MLACCSAYVYQALLHSLQLSLPAADSACCWLQVVRLLKDAWDKAGLDLYVAPYGCLPTTYECGIIEVSPLP